MSAREFLDQDLSGARFVRCDLSRVVVRGGAVEDADIDDPWLTRPGVRLLVNGVDVAPLVEAALNERFPGRGLRRAEDPDGLRAAWRAVVDAWARACADAETLPAETLEVSVDGEWSFTQTVRHLVMATDTWLHGAIHGRERPWHPFGQPHDEFAIDGHDTSVFADPPPAYAEVLAVRAERQAQVRELLAGVTGDDLDAERRHPWAPEHPVTVRRCVQTILNEEWEHLRYALRDLDTLREVSGSGSAASS